MTAVNQTISKVVNGNASLRKPELLAPAGNLEKLKLPFITERTRFLSEDRNTDSAQMRITSQ